MPKRPLDLLHASLQKPVKVELRGGREYRGALDGYDHPHLNLVLKDAEEIQEGATVGRHENLVVRGDAIIYIGL
jgi:small nuclear ribonucleoprotein